MNIIYTGVFLVVAYLIFRNRSLKKQLKSEIQEENKIRQKEKENKEGAKRVLPELRKLIGKESITRAEYDSISKDDWRMLANLRYGKDPSVTLADVGTTTEEVDTFKKLADDWYEFNKIMNRIPERGYWPDSLEWDLNKRDELLKKQGKTLLSYGIIGDDRDKLRRENHIAFARHIKTEVEEHLREAELELKRFEDEQKTFMFGDDFGLGQVRLNLERLENLK